MARTFIHYKDRTYNLDEYRVKTILEEDKEVRYFFAVYRGKEFKAKNLIELRGLLEIVFDAELKQGGIK